MSDNDPRDRPDPSPKGGLDLNKSSGGPPTDRYSQWLSVPPQEVRGADKPEPTAPQRSTDPIAPPATEQPVRAEPAPAAPPSTERQAYSRPAPDPEPARGVRDADGYVDGVRRIGPAPVAHETHADPYGETLRPRLAGVDPRTPTAQRSNRGLLLGGALAAVALAAVLGWSLTRDRDAPGAVVETVPPGVARADGGEPVRTQAAYAPPDRGAVRDAYGEVGRIYASAGVSGLAEAGRSCFANLGEAPSYRGLDYCGALDAYGAAFAHRVSGAAAPAESWFGQTEGRFVRSAEQVMGPERDAAARLQDIRRLAIEVARERGPTLAQAAPAETTSPEPAPAPTSVQVTPVEEADRTPPERPAPAPAPVQRAEAAAPRPAPARPAAPRPAGPPDREAYAAARPRDEGPTAAEVAVARPREGRGPSFNCRYARTESERLVCEDPRLASLDRRLNAAFEDAIAAGVPRRALRAEQDRWLSEREAAAPDPDAVADVYRRRIRELNGRE